MNRLAGPAFESLLTRQVLPNGLFPQALHGRRQITFEGRCLWYGAIPAHLPAHQPDLAGIFQCVHQVKSLSHRFCAG